MLLKNCVALLMVATAFSISINAQTPTEIIGAGTNGLVPHLFISKNGDDWSVEIDYVAQTNFTKNTWLKATNRVGSKLKLQLANKTEILSTNSDVLTALNLPDQTTVSNIINSVRPSNRRGLQWLWTKPGMLSGATTFDLQSAFGISFTNDYTLQITPLLYKVDSDKTTAHLTEFPRISVKLMSNGSVQRLN